MAYSYIRIDNPFEPLHSFQIKCEYFEILTIIGEESFAYL